MPVTPGLTRRSALLGKIETALNVDARPTPTDDAFLIMDAAFTANVSVLERQFYRSSLSGVPIGIGRKLASVSFKHELKGSGLASKVSKFGTLLRGCGFAQTLRASTAAALLGNPMAGYYNTGPAMTWAKGGAPTGNGAGRYTLTVVTAGASATAKIRVTGNPAGITDLTTMRSEEFSATVMAQGRANAPTITVDATDPTAVTMVVSGGWQLGDVAAITVGGYRHKVVAVGGEIGSNMASKLAAAVTAHPQTAVAAASASATLTLTPRAAQNVTVTTGTTALALGNSGLTLTPTFGANLVRGDQFVVDVLPAGWHYTPISTGFETMTLYVYYDGMLHRLTGCIGNVSFTCDAGQYAMATFTFTGQYLAPEDSPIPVNAVFEPSKPQQVELAQLALGTVLDIRAASFSVDMGITVTPRDSVSHPDGYDGMLYTARAPTGGMNPEATLESEEPYWKTMAAGGLLRLNGRVGTVPGNIVRIMSESVQIRNLTYADRNSARTYDMSLGFAQDQDAGDDELRIVVY